MTSNHHAPYDLGYTRATMDRTKGSETARLSQSHKSVLSSAFGFRSASPPGFPLYRPL